MDIDLTFYNKKHAYDMGFATEKAQSMIDNFKFRMNLVNGKVGDEAKLTATVEIFPGLSRVRFERLHVMIEQVLYSSGYFSQYTLTKKKKNYEIVWTMIEMTPEERAECHAEH